MAAITSNGTGGGSYSAGASWTGGAAPGLGDTAQIQNGDTITIDATFTVGDDTATPALDILNGGELDWDNAGSDTCTFRGDLYVRNGGTLTLDGTGTRTNILTIELNDSAALANGKYGLLVEDGGIVDVDGFDYTRAWDTLSADAAAAQADVVSTSDNSAIWFTGDTFIIGSMSEDAKTGAETDTIGAFAGTTITKAGANYSYAHEQNVAIGHVTRNIVFTEINTAFRGYIYIINTTDGNVDFAWCQFNRLGYNASNKFGVSFNATTSFGSFDGCSWWYGYRSLHNGTVTVQDCVFAFPEWAMTFASAGTFATSVCIGSDDHGIRYAPLTSVTGSHIANCDQYPALVNVTGGVAFDSCRFYGNGSNVYSVSNCSFTDCFMDGDSGFRIGGAIVRLTNFSFGAQVANDADVGLGEGIAVGTGLNTITLSVNIATTSSDFRCSFADTSNNHKTWKGAGTYEKQSAVKRTGTYAMLMSPTSAVNALTAESTVPASNGTQVVVSGYFRKNGTYGAANLPFLRLSGAGVTTDTDTMTDVDDTWELLTVSGTPTQDGFCKVEFVCQSAGAGAAMYVDDVKMVYTAIATGDMDYWFEGSMPPVLMNTGLGALDVWDVLLTQISAPLSIGTLLETNVDATVSSRATQAQILSDATPFAGANIDQSLSTTESNIRGADGDDLKDISDEIAALPPAPSAAAVAAAVWAAAAEGAITYAQAQRIFLSVLAGRSTGGGTNTIAFRDVANTKDRVRVQVDSNGNRVLVISLDGS